MIWNRKKNTEQIVAKTFYNFPIPKRRYILFPKLETIISQAEVHYEAGDFDMCRDILHLMWRAINKAESQMKADKSSEINQNSTEEINNLSCENDNQKTV